MIKRLLLIILVCGVVAGIGLWVWGGAKSPQPTRTVAIISPQGVHITVMVADSDSTRRLGLSGRADLPDGQGMIFIFPQTGNYPFWMKDMHFPIDIVWMDEGWVIIDRDVSISQETYPKTFISERPARYVLELPAGTADRDGFLVGGTVIMQNN